MDEKPIIKPELKRELHERNKHRGSYNFSELVKYKPELKDFIQQTKTGTDTIDFANPLAVRSLNAALLESFYHVKGWDIPEGYLCPPVPGRADYIHYAADLLGSNNRGIVPMGQTVRILDVGTGANIIYPIIGHAEYGWSFVGTDIDATAISNAQRIANKNPDIADHLEMRLQKNHDRILKGMIQADEEFDLVICNPPFYSNKEEAAEAVTRKWKNLGKQTVAKSTRNFGGIENELIYPGGEIAFILAMIAESQFLGRKCYWFTTLVSQQEHLPEIRKALRKVRPADVRTIEMSQGQKSSRFIAWTFMEAAEQRQWRERKFWDI